MGDPNNFMADRFFSSPQLFSAVNGFCVTSGGRSMKAENSE